MSDGFSRLPVPSQLFGHAEGVDLARDQSGALSIVQDVAINVQTLDKPAISFVEAGGRPEWKGVLKQPGLERGEGGRRHLRPPGVRVFKMSARKSSRRPPRKR